MLCALQIQWEVRADLVDLFVCAGRCTAAVAPGAVITPRAGSHLITLTGGLPRHPHYSGTVSDLSQCHGIWRSGCGVFPLWYEPTRAILTPLLRFYLNNIVLLKQCSNIVLLILPVAHWEILRWIQKRLRTLILSLTAYCWIDSHLSNCLENITS